MPNLARVLKRGCEIFGVGDTLNDEASSRYKRAQAIGVTGKGGNLDRAVSGDNVAVGERRRIVNSKEIVTFSRKPLPTPSRFQRRQSEDVFDRHAKLAGGL